MIYIRCIILIISSGAGRRAVIKLSNSGGFKVVDNIYLKLGSSRKTFFYGLSFTFIFALYTS